MRLNDYGFSIQYAKSLNRPWLNFSNPIPSTDIIGDIKSVWYNNIAVANVVIGQGAANSRHIFVDVDNDDIRQGILRHLIKDYRTKFCREAAERLLQQLECK